MVKDDYILRGVVCHQDAQALDAVAAGEPGHHLQKHHIRFGIVEHKLQACELQKERSWKRSSMQ